MADLVERLRRPLADRSGAAVRPTWFLRLDPDIERCYGRTDFVVDHYRAQIDQLRAQGDPFGIHVHYYRWDEHRKVSYSEHADTGWTTHCLDIAAHTFERCFGEPPRRASQGGFFVTDAVVDRAIALGIEVDVTAEPGRDAEHSGATFGAYTTAPSPDFRQYPRRPYYPSRAALGSPASSSDDARPMLMVPLIAYDYHRAWNHGTSGSPRTSSGGRIGPSLSTHTRRGRVPAHFGILSVGPPTRARRAMLRSRSGATLRAPRHTFTPESSSSICRITPSRGDCASSIPCRRRFGLSSLRTPGDAARGGLLEWLTCRAKISRPATTVLEFVMSNGGHA